MDKKKKIAIIVAVIVVIAAVAVTVALVTNKSDEPVYEDTYVEVTDENGDIVFDENGNVVTQLASKPASSTTAPKKESSSSDEGNANTSADANSNNTTPDDNNETNKPTEKETEKKPEKRMVYFELNLPYYFDPAKADARESELTVNYKVDGGNWEKLDLSKCNVTITKGDNKNSEEDIKNGKVRLDKAMLTFELGEFKGDVEVAIEMTNVTIRGNNGKADAFEDTVKISPVTGVEMIEGEDD